MASALRKLGGSTAFFQFAAAVFEAQDGLATADGATLTLNSATTKAGLDPAKIAACAAAPETKAAVRCLGPAGAELDITLVPPCDQWPTGSGQRTPYETLKQIIIYQAKLDDVTQ